jgi:hypothetical protein
LRDLVGAAVRRQGSREEREAKLLG